MFCFQRIDPEHSGGRSASKYLRSEKHTFLDKKNVVATDNPVKDDAFNDIETEDVDNQKDFDDPNYFENQYKRREVDLLRFFPLADHSLSVYDEISSTSWSCLVTTFS